MKLSKLSEGFDLDKLEEVNKNRDLAEMIFDFEAVFEEGISSRASVLRDTLKNMKAITRQNEITFGDEERKVKERLLVSIDETFDLLKDLPDGPPPAEILDDLHKFWELAHYYRTKYLHWSGKKLNER